MPKIRKSKTTDRNLELAIKIVKINKIARKYAKKLIPATSKKNSSFTTFLHIYYSSRQSLSRRRHTKDQIASQELFLKRRRSLLRKIPLKDRLILDQAVAIRDSLIEKNDSFLRKQAAKFARNPSEFHDLYSEAKAVAFYAAHCYLNTEIRFITYLGRVVCNRLHRYTIESSKVYHVPEEMKGLLAHYSRVEKSLISQGDRYPSFDEVTSHLKITDKQKQRLSFAMAHTFDESYASSYHQEDSDYNGGSRGRSLHSLSEVAVDKNNDGNFYSKIEFQEELEKVKGIIKNLELNKFEKAIIDAIMKGTPRAAVAAKFGYSTTTALNAFNRIKQNVVAIYQATG